MHNHPISKDLFQHYPKNRLLKENTLQEVQNLIDLKVGTNQIKKYVEQNTGSLCKSQDIHNIRAKLRKKDLGDRNQAEYLIDTITELTERYGDLKLELAVDEETNEFRYIYIQTDAMAHVASKYCDLLFVDGTYKVNMEGYPLYPFLVEEFCF